MIGFNFQHEAQSEDESNDGARRQTAADSGRGVRGVDPAAADDNVCGACATALVGHGTKGAEGLTGREKTRLILAS